MMKDCQMFGSLQVKPSENRDWIIDPDTDLPQIIYQNIRALIQYKDDILPVYEIPLWR